MGKTLLFIGFGGFLGSVARYLLSHYLSEPYPSDFPWATLAANLIGCFIIGIVFGLLSTGQGLSKNLVFFLSVGFCGALTTFSTFSLENITLLQRGKIVLLIVYSGLTYTLGLFFTWVGLSITRYF